MRLDTQHISRIQALLGIAVLGISMRSAIAGSSFEIGWHTVDGGGGTSSGGIYEVSGTAGQPDAGGPMVGGMFQLTGGYWAAAGPTVNPCPADIAPFSGDGIVNAADLLMVINHWGACPGPCPPACASDINHDCVTNAADLLAVINNWGSCP